jgi:hypothetical protein
MDDKITKEELIQVCVAIYIIPICIVVLCLDIFLRSFSWLYRNVYPATIFKRIYDIIHSEATEVSLYVQYLMDKYGLD